MKHVKAKPQVTKESIYQAVKTSTQFEGGDLDRALENKSALENLKRHNELFPL